MVSRHGSSHRGIEVTQDSCWVANEFENPWESEAPAELATQRFGQEPNGTHFVQIEPRALAVDNRIVPGKP